MISEKKMKIDKDAIIVNPKISNNHSSNKLRLR